MPSSPESGARPRFSAPSTLVVMPEECQSIPITAPNDWNQKGWAKPPQQLVAAVFMDDRLGDHRTQPGHAIAKPFGHAAAMERKVGAAGAVRHQWSTGRWDRRYGVGPVRDRGLAGEERQLRGDARRRFVEVRDGDAKQPNALGGGQERADELDARLSQPIMPRDRRGEGAASGGLAEVGELHLDGHGPAESLFLLAPGPDIIRHRLHARLDFRWLGQVSFEGGLGAGRFSRTVGDDRTVILAIRDAEIPCGRFAEMLLQESERLRSQVRTRLDAETLHLRGCHRPDAVELRDRQRRDEGRTLFGCDHILPVRLVIAGRQFGEELVIGDTR